MKTQKHTSEAHFNSLYSKSVFVSMTTFCKGNLLPETQLFYTLNFPKNS